MDALELPAYEHLIIPPAAENDAPDDAHALVAIAPGAFLPPDAFKSLAASVQAASPHLRLWVGVLSLDVLSLMQLVVEPALLNTPAAFEAYSAGMRRKGVYGKLLLQLLGQAVEAGFTPHREGPDRIGNMVVLCQSAGGLGFPEAAASLAAASILLASLPNAEVYPQRKVLSMETWARPLMILGGELDGQMRWPWTAPYIAEAAAMASKFGERYVARNKPVVLLPDINHGNTSNGVPRVVRGDITAGVAPYEECMQMLGGHVGAFLTAHLALTEEARTQAEEVLLGAVRQSAKLTAPYCIAAGLGDTAAPFVEGVARHPPAKPPAGPVRVGGMVASATRSAGHAESIAVPPGVVAAAEAHAADLQRRVMASLPDVEAERVTVIATAHSEVGTFTHSQPVMRALGGGRWLLHVHVMLNFKSMESSRPHICSYAPEYWVKLKCAQMVAQVLGLTDPASYDTPNPADLNRLAFDTALAATPTAVAERYRKLGRQMEFEGDMDVLGNGSDGASSGASEELFRDAHIAYHHPQPAGTGPPATPPAQPPAPGSLGTVRVGSPYLLIAPPAGAGASTPSGEAAAMGPFYAKVLSVPLAMEWVWLDCLREMATPW